MIVTLILSADLERNWSILLRTMLDEYLMVYDVGNGLSCPPIFTKHIVGILCDCVMA